MRVKMRQQMSGQRGDGSMWPGVGEEVEVDDDEGKVLAENGLAFPVRADEANVEYRDVDAVEAEEVESGYDGLTKAELAAELEKRGLTKSGNRDELQARLEEDDAGEDAEAADVDDAG